MKVNKINPTGYDKMGEMIIFDVFYSKHNFDGRINYVIAEGKDLVELNIPEGITEVLCDNNHLKELKLPTSLLWLRCDGGLFDYETCNVEWVNIMYKF